jgi:DNA repair protein RecN (Recombination protein N)
VLSYLRVRDLAVLEDVEVSFGDGLTVVTGETGAGKSLVVDALLLLSGERADASLIRAGAERLVVEGVFESGDAEIARVLEEGGIERPSGEVVVRREVAAGGKGRLFVNGSPAPLRLLSEIASRLLVLYGQAEARELLDPSVPRELLDAFAGCEESAARTAELFVRFRTADVERSRVAALAQGRAERLGLLDFQIGEVDALRPKPGEDDALAAEKAVLSNVERVGRLLSDAALALESEEGGALAALATARRAFASLAELDRAHAARAAEMTELIERVSGAAAEAARSLERLDADPGRLAEIAERLDGLARLKRKYGPTLEDVLVHRGAVGRERDELADLEGTAAKAAAAAAQTFDAYRSAALELSAARSAAAPRLSRAVETELRDLAFLKSSFRVEIGRREAAESAFAAGGDRVAFGPHGIDQVTLAFAPNPGEPPRPLGKIASGGELARVQLAVAAALAKAGTRGNRRRPARTFVFDEVDAGVSGATADAVGEKLRALAEADQVLVVTHLPQVAAKGGAHLAVEKEAIGGRTTTRVTRLDPRGRVEAIAAMLAGARVGDAAREHARQLLGITSRARR